MRTILLFAVLASAVFAQVDRGNIQGTITDPSGAVVSNAAVRIVSPATNLTQSTVTGPSGTYAFFNLPIGLYNVSVEGKGFRRADVTGVKVEVNQQAKVDVSLQVGEVTQSVEVSCQCFSGADGIDRRRYGHRQQTFRGPAVDLGGWHSEPIGLHLPVARRLSRQHLGKAYRRRRLVQRSDLLRRNCALARRPRQ